MHRHRTSRFAPGLLAAAVAVSGLTAAAPVPDAVLTSPARPDALRAPADVAVEVVAGLTSMAFDPAVSLAGVDRILRATPDVTPLSTPPPQVIAEDGAVSVFADVGSQTLDVDGDGTDEVLLQVSGDDGERVEARRGSDGAVVWTVPTDGYAYLVPDVDGDGVGDLLQLSLDATIEHSVDCDGTGCTEQQTAAGTWRVVVHAGADGAQVLALTEDLTSRWVRSEHERGVAPLTSDYEYRQSHERSDLAFIPSFRSDLDAAGRGLVVTRVDLRHVEERSEESVAGVTIAGSDSWEYRLRTAVEVVALDGSRRPIPAAAPEMATFASSAGDVDGDGIGDLLLRSFAADDGWACRSDLLDSGCEFEGGEWSSTIALVDGSSLETRWSTEGSGARAVGSTDAQAGADVAIEWQDTVTVVDGATGEPRWSAASTAWLPSPLGHTQDDTPVLLLERQERSSDGQTWFIDRVDARDGTLLHRSRFGPCSCATFALPRGDHDGDGVRDLLVEHWGWEDGDQGGVQLVSALGGVLLDVGWDAWISPAGDVDGSGRDAVLVTSDEGERIVDAVTGTVHWTIAPPDEDGWWTGVIPVRRGSDLGGIVLDRIRYEQQPTDDPNTDRWTVTTVVTGHDGIDGTLRWTVGPYVMEYGVVVVQAE